MNAKRFKNPFDEDFTWKWDGVAYTFKAGKDTYLEDYKADHFASHLVDREMNKLGIVTSSKVERDRLTALCFLEEETPTEDLLPEIKPSKKLSNTAENEFEDLQVVPKKKK